VYSYCITLCLFSGYAWQRLCLADYLAYCNTYFVSAKFSCYDIVSLRGTDVWIIVGVIAVNRPLCTGKCTK